MGAETAPVVYLTRDFPPTDKPGWSLTPQPTTAYDFDKLVIGSGPAGQRAAIQAAKLGTRATIIEQRAVIGGVCINTGTIPSKTLREAGITCRGIANAISTERRIP
jgi:hypothetical protein